MKERNPSEVVEKLVDEWTLQPHPEGGWYRELHRSPVLVVRPDQQQRCAISTILYLLDAGSLSRWHRVSHADEVLDPPTRSSPKPLVPQTRGRSRHSRGVVDA